MYIFIRHKFGFIGFVGDDNVGIMGYKWLRYCGLV
jgi:hypothetical protein